MRRPRFTLTITLSLFLVIVGSQATAATLNIVGGRLMGASNVEVGGLLYDVEFLDSTCIALFDGCDSAFDFTFSFTGGSQLAGQALLDQVLVDGPAGNFDSNPALTNGCLSSTECTVLTLHAFSNGSFIGISARNRVSEISDGIGARSGPIGIDLGGNPALTFARWTPVPEPGPGLLVFLGLAAMASQRPRSN